MPEPYRLGYEIDRQVYQVYRVLRDNHRSLELELEPVARFVQNGIVVRETGDPVRVQVHDTGARRYLLNLLNRDENVFAVPMIRTDAVRRMGAPDRVLVFPATGVKELSARIQVENDKVVLPEAELVRVYTPTPLSPAPLTQPEPEPEPEMLASQSIEPVLVDDLHRFAREFRVDAYQYLRPHNETDLRRVMRYVTRNPMHAFLAENVAVRLPEFEYTEQTLRIGYVVMTIPPQSISVVHRSGLTRLPLLRGTGTIKKNVPLSLPVVSIQFTVDREGVSSILIPLLRQIDRMPFLPVQNRLLNDVHKIYGLAVQDVQVATVEGVPYALQVTLVAAAYHERAIRYSHYEFGENWCWPLFKLYTDYRPVFYDRFTGSDTGPLVRFQVPSVEYLMTSDLANLPLEMVDESVRPLVGSLFRFSKPDLVQFHSVYRGDDLLQDPEALWGVMPVSEPMVKLETPHGSGYAIRCLTLEQLEVMLNGFAGAFPLQEQTVSSQLPNRPAVMQYGHPNHRSQLRSLSLQDAGRLAAELTTYLDRVHDSESQQDGERSRWQDVLSSTWFYLPDLRYLQQGLFQNELSRLLAQYLTSHPNVEESDGADQYEEVPIDGVTWTGVTAQFTNNIVELDNVGTDPVLQYLGKGDVVIRLTGICDDEESAQSLRQLYDYFRMLSFTYRGVLMNQRYGGYLRIINDLASSLGVEYTVPLDIAFSTVPGVPGAQQVEITLLSFQPNQKEYQGYRRMSDVTDSTVVTARDRMAAAQSVYQEFDNWVAALFETELYPDLRLPKATDVIRWIRAMERIGQSVPISSLTEYERAIYRSLSEVWGESTREMCKQYASKAKVPSLYKMRHSLRDYYMDPDFFVAYREDLLTKLLARIVTEADQEGATDYLYVDRYDQFARTNTVDLSGQDRYGSVYTGSDRIDNQFDFVISLDRSLTPSDSLERFTEAANRMERAARDRVTTERQVIDFREIAASFSNEEGPAGWDAPLSKGHMPTSAVMRIEGVPKDRRELAKRVQPVIQQAVQQANVKLSDFRQMYPGEEPGWRQRVGRYRIDESLVHAIITSESTWDPNAVSSAGAKGLMQVTPIAEQSALRSNTSLRLQRKDLFSPEYNIRVGVEYFTGGMKQAIHTYHRHQSRLRQWVQAEVLRGIHPPISASDMDQAIVNALSAMYYHAGPNGFSTIVQSVLENKPVPNGYVPTIQYARRVVVHWNEYRRYGERYAQVFQQKSKPAEAVTGAPFDSYSLSPWGSYTVSGSSLAQTTPSPFGESFTVLPPDDTEKPPASSPSLAAPSVAVRSDLQDGENLSAGKNWFLTGWMDELLQYPANRLLLCFPTVSVMLILGFRWIRHVRFWNQFYGMFGLMSVDVWKSRRHPSDVAELMFANTYNKVGQLTWTRAYEEQAMTQFGWIDRERVSTLPGYLAGLIERLPRQFRYVFGDPTEDPTLRDFWSREYRGLLLKPGVKLHIRIGYGANLYELEPTFSGMIVETDTEEGQISVVAQGFGAELENPLGVKVYKRMGFLGAGDEPRNIVSNLFTATPTGPLNIGVAINMLSAGRWLHRNAYGIENFGMVVYNSPFQWDDAEAGVNLYNSQPIAENVSPWAFGYYNLLGLGDLVHSTHSITVEVENGTPWDVIRACQMSIFDWIASVVPFEYRSTLFFGAGYHPLYYSYRIDLSTVDLSEVEGSTPPVGTTREFNRQMRQMYGSAFRGGREAWDPRVLMEDARLQGRLREDDVNVVSSLDLWRRLDQGIGAPDTRRSPQQGDAQSDRMRETQRSLLRDQFSVQRLMEAGYVLSTVGWNQWHTSMQNVEREERRRRLGETVPRRELQITVPIQPGMPADYYRWYPIERLPGRQPGDTFIEQTTTTTRREREVEDAMRAPEVAPGETPPTQNFWAKLMYAKQFRQYHIVSSQYNLLSNSISASSEKVYTQVAAMDSNGTPGNMIMLDPFIIGEDQRMKLVKSNLYTSIMQRLSLADGNWLSVITSLPILRGLFEGIGAVTPVRTVNNVAVNTMREGLMDMYQGSFSVVGNPGIKPYDLCYLHDETSRMMGPVFVKEVIHRFSLETGFVTLVAPDCVVVTNRDKELASILYASSVAQQVVWQLMVGRGDTETVQESLPFDESILRSLSRLDARRNPNAFWLVALPVRLIAYRLVGQGLVVSSPVLLRWALSTATALHRFSRRQTLRAVGEYAWYRPGGSVSGLIGSGYRNTKEWRQRNIQRTYGAAPSAAAEPPPSRLHGLIDHWEASVNRYLDQQMKLLHERVVEWEAQMGHLLQNAGSIELHHPKEVVRRYVDQTSQAIRHQRELVRETAEGLRRAADGIARAVESGNAADLDHELQRARFYLNRIRQFETLSVEARSRLGIDTETVRRLYQSFYDLVTGEYSYGAMILEQLERAIPLQFQKRKSLESLLPSAQKVAQRDLALQKEADYRFRRGRSEMTFNLKTQLKGQAKGQKEVIVQSKVVRPAKKEATETAAAAAEAAVRAGQVAEGLDPYRKTLPVPLGERALVHVRGAVGAAKTASAAGSKLTAKIVRFLRSGTFITVLSQSVLDWISRWLDQYYACLIVPLRVDGKEFSAGIRGHVGSVIGDNPSFIQTSLSWLDPDHHPWAALIAGLFGISKASGPLHTQAESLRQLYEETTGVRPDRSHWESYLAMLDERLSMSAAPDRTAGQTYSAAALRAGKRLLAWSELPESAKHKMSRARPPLLGTVWMTSDQGPRNPRVGSKFHRGLDLVSDRGSRAPVVATLDGVVAYAGELGGYGNLVVIDHGDGLYSYYGHLSRVQVKRGDRLVAGQTLGLMGSTGVSTGPHLHFEFRVGPTWDNSAPAYIPDPVEARLRGVR